LKGEIEKKINLTKGPINIKRMRIINDIKSKNKFSLKSEIEKKNNFNKRRKRTKLVKNNIS
jgi:hypothetical protein